jgi:hypothetical protein
MPLGTEWMTIGVGAADGMGWIEARGADIHIFYVFVIK